MKQSNWFGIGAIVLSILALIPYCFHSPVFVRAGDTYLGLGYGVICGVLTIGLMMLGIKKTIFIANLGSYKAWVNTHNYIGVSLLIFTLLHAGFQFDANIHGSAVFLLIVLVVSGLLGAVSYQYFPSMIERLRPWLDTHTAYEKLNKKNAELLEAAEKVNPILNKFVWDLVREPSFEGVGIDLKRSIVNLFIKKDSTQALLQDYMAIKAKKIAANNSEYEQFNYLLKDRMLLVGRLRKAGYLSYILQAWRTLHKFVSRAFFIVLIVHVVAVFMY